MARGKQVETGKVLVNFNSKVQEETRDAVDAIVKTKGGGVGSYREFIERAVAMFAEAHPEDMEKAKQYLELMGKGVQ